MKGKQPMVIRKYIQRKYAACWRERKCRKRSPRVGAHLRKKSKAREGRLSVLMVKGLALRRNGQKVGGG